MLRLAARFRNENHFAHFDFFVPQVFLVEVIISVLSSLASGAGLAPCWERRWPSTCHRASIVRQASRPWQYLFLIVVMVQFRAVPLGLDVFLAKRAAVTSVRYLVCYDGWVKAPKST